MSALGQKPTYALQQAMSALHLKADMCSAIRDVRFVPSGHQQAALTTPLAKRPRVSRCGGVWLPRNVRLLLRTHAESARHPTDAPQAS